jgi:hypothetical protein
VTSYVRPSSLGVAEFCPRSADLNEQSGISRAAIISTAWHAKLAGNDTLIGELHPDERKEVATWGSPTTAIVATHHDKLAVDLDYDSAEKELHVQVLERDSLITEGTLDFAWVREINGRRWAFVADLKRSTWAIPEGPDCLQLAAYGHAYAALRSCDGYTPGLWSGTDSEWSWGQPIDLTTPEALDVWLRVKRAARNDWRLKVKEDDKRFVTGAHCGACYGRMRCPEYALLDAPDDAIENFAEYDPARLLLNAQSMTERAERIKETVKVFAERGGVVKDPATGKVYLPTVCQGRLGLDKEAAAKAGFDVSKFQTRGKPYSQFGWRKA